MKKNKVVILGKNGEQFEFEFRRFSKSVKITCVKAKRLNFKGAIEELVKGLNLETVDEEGIIEISYRCKNRQVFEELVKTLKKT